MGDKNKIIQGDTLEVLKTLPDECVDTIITSPPYYGLRDYGTAKWEGGDINCDHQVGRNTRKSNKWMEDKLVAGTFGDEAIKNGEKCPKCGAKRIDQQIGLEKTLDEYLLKMLLITSELKRVLKKTGTMWWNHGDSYGGSGMGLDYSGHTKGINSALGDNTLNSMPAVAHTRGFYEKSLLMQNYRLAIRMCDEQQWTLRNQIIWHKPNCMPSSVKDRFTVDFEPVFFFSKSKKYWFEMQYEKPHDLERLNHRLVNPETNRKWEKIGNSINKKTAESSRLRILKFGRQKRCVWKIPTHPFKDAHFATFPEKLIEPMIKAGCPPQGIVLDPFMGSGTTAYVARKLGRNYLGIELNPAYIKMAEKRLSQQVLI